MFKKLFTDKESLKIMIIGVQFIACLIIFHFVSAPSPIELCVYAALYLAAGYECVIGAFKKFLKKPFNEKMLMVVASVGSFVLGCYEEAVAVMLLYALGEYIEDLAHERSRNSITALMEAIPKTAHVLRDDGEFEVDVDDVLVGDTLILRPGDTLCCDGQITFGSAYVDCSALTGESAPISRLTGDFVESGSIITGGAVHVLVKKVSKESASQRILELVSNTEKTKAKQEKFITRFAKVYTPVVLGLALILAVVPSAITGDWREWVSRALNFLVVSCPCALVISVPLAFFAGMGTCFSNGIIVKGGTVLDKLSNVKIIGFDKTGTLTKGELKVVDVVDCEDKIQVLEYAAICESGSNHPIAKAILSAAPSVDNKGYEIKEYPARGVYAFNQEVGLYVGCREFLIENSIVVPSKIISETHVYVAKDGQYVGAIIFGDTIRDGAKSLIESLKAQEIKTYLLTGDTEIVGYRVRDELLMDDVYAKLNPIEKIEKLKALANGQAFAFVGDGINDAPVLSGADVGIAMGGGTKAAIECADVMIHNDDITKIPKLLKTAKKTMRVVYTNIIFSISVKALALVLSAAVAIPIWSAIFADVGVMLIATINSLSLSTKDKHHHHNNHDDHHHHKHECDCC